MKAAKEIRNNPAPKRILVVDDHPVLREGLFRLINREGDLTICGEAENASQTMEALSKLRPDLVLLDLNMPGKGGLELLKDILTLRPEMLVLVLSMLDESLYADRLLRAGASGYIMKQERSEKVIEAIRLVLSGQIYVSENVRNRIMSVFCGGRTKGVHGLLDCLTDREFEVLNLVAQFKSSHEIANELHISVRTVDVHRAHLKTKLALKSSLEVTHYAVRWLEGQSRQNPLRTVEARQPIRRSQSQKKPEFQY